jgi:hypothetical protein
LMTPLELDGANRTQAGSLGSLAIFTDEAKILGRDLL